MASGLECLRGLYKIRLLLRSATVQVAVNSNFVLKRILNFQISNFKLQLLYYIFQIIIYSLLYCKRFFSREILYFLQLLLICAFTKYLLWIQTTSQISRIELYCMLRGDSHKLEVIFTYHTHTKRRGRSSTITHPPIKNLNRRSFFIQ